jgi:Protein of unknown function (DUF3054)
VTDPAGISRRATMLAIGDVFALLVFTLIGLANHKDGISAANVLKVMGPLVIVGGVAAVIFGTYRRPGIRTLLPAWLAAVPVAILIRKAMFHTPASWSSTGIFIGVALAFTLIFIVAWRWAARYALRRI